MHQFCQSHHGRTLSAMLVTFQFKSNYCELLLCDMFLITSLFKNKVSSQLLETLKTCSYNSHGDYWNIWNIIYVTDW